MLSVLLLTSRGTIRLRSNDPADAPEIRFNYMSTEQDWADFRACVRLTREIFDQPAFAPYRGPEIQPGAGVESDGQIDSFIREHAESAFHPCGSARMKASACAARAASTTSSRVASGRAMRMFSSMLARKRCTS